MEGKVYRVKKSTIKGKVRLAVVGNSKLKVLGDDDEDAEELLQDLICTHYGDGEPVFAYEYQVAALGKLFTFSSNEQVRMQNVSALVKDGVCSFCGTPKGEADSATVAEISDKVRTDLAYCVCGRMFLSLFSERLLSLFYTFGLTQEDFLAVRDIRGKPFYFPRTSARKLDWVSPKAKLANRAGANRCPKCGYKSFLFVDPVSDSTAFLSKSEWEKYGLKCAIVGQFESNVVVTGEVHKTILANKSLKGLCWENVGLLDKAAIDFKLKYDVLKL